jgi:hypothetical protein
MNYKFVTSLEALPDRAIHSAPAIVEDFSSSRMAREYDLWFQTAVAGFSTP